MAITITNANFEQEVVQSDRPVLVDFWATWCGPCRMIAPIIDQIANEHPEIKVGKINIDEEPELAEQFEVSNIPTFIVFKGGQPVEKAVGPRPKALLLKMLD